MLQPAIMADHLHPPVEVAGLRTSADFLRVFGLAVARQALAGKKMPVPGPSGLGRALSEASRICLPYGLTPGEASAACCRAFAYTWGAGWLRVGTTGRRGTVIDPRRQGGVRAGSAPWKRCGRRPNLGLRRGDSFPSESELERTRSAGRMASPEPTEPTKGWRMAGMVDLGMGI